MNENGLQVVLVFETKEKNKQRQDPPEVHLRTGMFFVEKIQRETIE